MGTRRSIQAPSKFALAVREEVLAELGRRGMNTFSLSKLIDRGNSYLAERVKNPNKELTLNDLELICNALSVDLNALMSRAIAAFEAEQDLNLSDLADRVTDEDLKEDFDLAAHPHDEGDEVDYESYH